MTALFALEFVDRHGSNLYGLLTATWPGAEKFWLQRQDSNL
ncbi:MAG: hypothetical protein NZ739_02660 [Verrucomicrobiae bacterium]|nr:hypothetical protein [Verrucomicrobiae bacterium]MDW7979248.1 hypothetical protein [Verrucomicrobiales bacterium]